MFREFSDSSRSEEFLNEFRQKMADQTASNIEERQNELKRSKSVFIGTLAGLVLAGMIGGFILAPKYNKNVADLPIIKAPAEPVKVAPEDRGGMTIENQDKSVYEILESTKKTEEIATVLPAPETPKVPEAVAPEDEYAPATMDEIIQGAEEEVLSDASKVLTGRTQDQISGQSQEEKVESIADVNRDKMNEIKAAVDNKLKGEETAKVEKNTPAEVKTTASKSVASAGDWQIQIMSSPNRESIDKSWKDLQAKHAFFTGLPHEIEKADLGASGIYYRLKVGAYDQKETADDVCEQYKAVRGSCLVKKK